MKAVQAMLLQTEGDKIFLLPAWPKDWDVKFKLHAPKQTVIEGVVSNGALVSYTVTPAAAPRGCQREHQLHPALRGDAGERLPARVVG